MALRDLVVLALTYGLLPVAVFRPFVGLLLYSWLAYMRPQDLAWGISDTNLSRWAMLALLLGCVLKLGRERFVVVKPQTVGLMFFAFWIVLSSQTAVFPDTAEYWTELILKITLLCLLTTGLVSSELRLRLLWATIAFSLGALGLKFGLFSLRQGGVGFNYGPVDALADNNKFAVALCMTLPLLFAMSTVERRFVVRLAALLVAWTSLVAIISTFSRGGFLALVAVLGLLSIRSRRFAITTLVGVGVLVLSLSALPEEFTAEYRDRISTIENYEEDESAMGRIIGWQASWRVSRDYPLLGVGPQNFPRVAALYGGIQGKVAHNTFFQLLAENGWPAAIALYGLIVLVFVRLGAVRRRAPTRLYREYASALQVSLVGYVVGSMTLNIVYYELIYHLIALSVPLELLAAQESAAEVATAEPASGWPGADGALEPAAAVRR